MSDDLQALRAELTAAEEELADYYRAAGPLTQRVLTARADLFDALRERGELWVLRTHRYHATEDMVEEFATKEEAEGMAEADYDSDDGSPVRLTGPNGYERRYQ